MKAVQVHDSKKNMQDSFDHKWVEGLDRMIFPKNVLIFRLFMVLHFIFL